MISATLIYCIKDDFVLLGMKKRGFGAGKLNGYGGKVHTGEQINESAARELFEESDISCNEKDLEKVAEIDFFFQKMPKKKSWDQKVHVFLLRKWIGEPKETEEMKPEWHRLDSIPLEKMWIDDPFWLPKILQGEKLKAQFVFSKEGESILDHKITVLEESYFQSSNSK